MRELDRGEARDFMLSGTRTAVLSTTNADGSPHAVPVWFDLDGEQVVMLLTGGTRKLENLQRDRRAAICVQDDQPPFGFVELRGVCTLAEDADDKHYWARRMAVRYMGEERADEIAERNAAPGEVLVRLTAEHMAAQVEIAA